MKAEFSLRNLSPALGVEVCGIDLRESVDEAVAAALREAFRDRLLVLFRGQRLTVEDHVRAVGLLGPVMDEFADGSSHSLVSNMDPDAYIGPTGNDYELIYHSDLTSTDSPPWGLSLYAMDISDEAPPTRYVSAEHAYRNLPEGLRETLDELMMTDGFAGEEDAASSPPLLGHLTTHPAVIEHPRNGKRQLYCSRMWTHRIVGMERVEARLLLDDLFENLYAPSNLYEHNWAPGDLVIWDNIGLQHGRDPIPRGCRRRFRRVAMGENKPGQIAAARWGRDSGRNRPLMDLG